MYLLITGPNTAINLQKNGLEVMFPDVQSVLTMLATHQYHRVGHQDGASEGAEAATMELLRLLAKWALAWAERWSPVGVLR